MKRNNRPLIRLAIGISIPIIFGQTSGMSDCTSDAAVKHQITSVDARITTREAFWRALIAAQVPGGIVWDRNCADIEIKPQPVPSPSPLREALNRIVRADPQYKWHLESGAINLVPTGGEPDLLKVRLRRFRIQNVSNVNLALEMLLALPEVRKATAQLQLNPGLKLGGLSSPHDEKLRLAVNCEHVTLREALNCIARAQGRAIWQYSEWHCSGKNQFAIEFVAH